jgi:hypothetical protein
VITSLRENLFMDAKLCRLMCAIETVNIGTVVEMIEKDKSLLNIQLPGKTKRSRKVGSTITLIHVPSV